MSRVSDKHIVENYTISTPGDPRSEVSFALLDGVGSPANVTGLAFSNASTRAFSAVVSVVIDAATDLYEVFHIDAIQRGSDWAMNYTSVGDDSGVEFSITNAGQVQYTSLAYTTFVSGTLKARVFTTSV
jgi:hypothetical protein